MLTTVQDRQMYVPCPDIHLNFMLMIVFRHIRQHHRFDASGALQRPVQVRMEIYQCLFIQCVVQVPLSCRAQTTKIMLLPSKLNSTASAIELKTKLPNKLRPIVPVTDKSIKRRSRSKRTVCDSYALIKLPNKLKPIVPGTGK
jgi:hypothetical protein